MGKIKLLKLTMLFMLVCCLSSFIKEKEAENLHKKMFNNIDTIIVKQENKLNSSFEVDFYSKSYTYYWLVGNDTLDFTISVIEYKKDSALALGVYHKKPMLFATMLTRINTCYSIIKKDFSLSKLNSFSFSNPIYYVDLTSELSKEYELQYKRKNISYEKLNRFLLNSSLTKQLYNVTTPLGKKVKRYGIEKFHLLDKKYYNSYLHDVDLTAYPEFAINGMGIYVQLANK